MECNEVCTRSSSKLFWGSNQYDASAIAVQKQYTQTQTAAVDNCHRLTSQLSCCPAAYMHWTQASAEAAHGSRFFLHA